MAKLYFNYSTMNAGKSAILLQADHNYRERGMRTLLLTAAIDDRPAGDSADDSGGDSGGDPAVGVIASRIGIQAPARRYSEEEDLYERISASLEEGPLACVLIDEAQFLQPAQVWQLARVADELKIPVMAYGLRVDFRGQPFPGSATLLALADSLREIRTICHCGSKATMVIRKDESGRTITDGAQVQIGGDESYVSLCRVHWREAFHGTSA